MSKPPLNIEKMGWRELTEAEVGYLMTTRNYAGSLIIKFVALKKDAAAIDLHSENEAEELMSKLRRQITKIGANRSLQAFFRGSTVFLTKVQYGEDLTLSEEQKKLIL